MSISLAARCLLGIWLMLLVACASDNREDITPEASAQIYTRLGMEYLRMGKLNVALEKLQTAIDLDAKNVEAQDAIAVLYEKIKLYPDAQRHFEIALKLRPESASTLNNYGRFLCDRGEYDEAVSYLQKAMALPLNDNKWYAHTNLGRCELLRGNQDAAETNFRQALQLQEKYAPALLEMQRISYRQGKYLSARAFLQRYLEVAEHTAGTLWTAIETEKALGNPEAARLYREMLMQKFPTSNEAKQILSSEK